MDVCTAAATRDRVAVTIAANSAARTTSAASAASAATAGTIGGIDWW